MKQIPTYNYRLIEINLNSPILYQGGVTQVRFQPGLGKVLAAAVNNLILMFDTETLSCRFKLQVSCELCLHLHLSVCDFIQVSFDLK